MADFNYIRRLRGEDPSGDSPDMAGVGISQPLPWEQGYQLPDSQPAPESTPEVSPTPPPESSPQEQPVFQQDEPWQTSLFNVGKNIGQKVQDFTGNLFGAGGDPNSFRGKISQAVSFFPTLGAATLGLAAKAYDPQAQAAYERNRVTLEGGEAAPWDFPATARGLIAAEKTRAEEGRQAAENSNLPMADRERGLALQGIYGALPNFAPVGILPKGTLGLAARGAGEGINLLDRGAGALSGKAAGVAERAPAFARRFVTEDAGMARPDLGGVEAVRAMLRRNKGREPTDAEVQQAVEASKAFQGEGDIQLQERAPSSPAQPDHLNPEVVGPEKAARNQQVHDTKQAFTDALTRASAGDSTAVKEAVQHFQTLRSLGVKDTAIAKTLKDAGLGNDPKLASLIADMAPSKEANANLAASRGVSPAAAVRGTLETPEERGLQLKARAAETPKPGLVPSTTAAALRRQLNTPAAVETPIARRARLVAEAKARLAQEESPASPASPPTISAKPTPAGLSLLTDKNVSAEELLAQRSRARMEGTPLGNPAGTSAGVAEPPPLPVMPKPKGRPANTQSNATTTAPVVSPAGPALGTKINGGVVVQKASATAGPAIRRKVAVAPESPPVTPIPTSPSRAPAAAAPAAPTVAPAAGAPAQGVRTPGLPTPNRGVGSAGGTAATGMAKVAGTGRTRAPVTLNPTTFQYEARTPQGVVIGTGATQSAAIKAAQQYLANNPPGGAGKPPVKGGGGAAGGPPMKGGKPFSVPQKNSLISEVGNTARAAETTGDISYTLRQGFILAAGHPIEAIKAFASQVGYIANALRRQGDRFAFETMDKIQNTPEFAEIQRLKPDLLTSWDAKLGPLEEGFLASRLNSLPILKQSNIAAVLFLNKLRYGVARQAIKSAGSDVQKKAVLDFTSAATGRANFPKWLEQHANTMAAIGYSPRFLGSRFEILAALPKAAITRNPYLAKEAARDIVSAYVLGKMVTGLAQLNGAKVVQDGTSPDWGKIQVGNTRVDLWGGYQPIFRLINQAYEGKRTYIQGEGEAQAGGTQIDRLTGMPAGYKWDSSGNTTNVADKSPFSQLLDKYRPSTGAQDFLEKSIYGKFIRSKLAPIPGALTDWFVGKDYAGQPFSAEKEAARMITPLGWQDIYEAIADDKRTGGSGLQGAATGALSLLGAGVQTIPENNTQYPLLSEVAGGAVARAFNAGGGGLDLGGTTPATPTPKPSKTPKPSPTLKPSSPSKGGKLPWE